MARRRAVEPRDERRRHGTRERTLCLLPGAGQCDLVKKMALTDVTGTTCSVIVWTDVAAHMFVKAEQPSSVHAGIASFYDFWHHQFG